MAVAVDAQLLVLLSDVDGFLQDGNVLERVETLDHTHRAAISTSPRQTTKGGMSSKLEAARIVGHSGIPMVLASGARPSVLAELMAGRAVGTLFVPPRNRLTSRKWWIAYALREPNGTLVVDSGAAHALVERGKSLLATGLRDVRGRFEAGAFVAVADETGTEVARGIANYSSADLLRVRGLKSAEVARTLGHPRAPEVIHRNQLVLVRELRHGE